jgi:hypothetical protein
MLDNNQAIDPKSSTLIAIMETPQPSMEEPDPTTLIPPGVSGSPEHLEQEHLEQHHQDGMMQQQQGYIGFGIDPNWGFGQMMHGQAG